MAKGMIDNMLNFGPTFIWVVLNLLILYFFLNKFVFTRLTVYMEVRAQGIKESLDNADKSRSDAAKLLKEYEEQLRVARQEADIIIENAKAKAAREYEVILHEAKKDAAGVIARAAEEAEREKQRSMGEVKAYASGLALAAASKVLEANMDTVSNRAIVDKFIDEAGVA